MICEKCNVAHNGTYGSGRFCTSQCARSFSTSVKRQDINEKIAVSLKKPSKTIVCVTCGKKRTDDKVRKHTLFCDAICLKNNLDLKEKRSKAMSMTLKAKFANNLDARNRMREIGRKGGFGTRCKTNSNIRCDSLFEKKSFEILEEFGMDFAPHKVLPNSSRISDAFLPLYNVWVEFDGINREKRYKGTNSKLWNQWEGKLLEYARNELSVVILTSHADVRIFCKSLKNKMC